MRHNEDINCAEQTCQSAIIDNKCLGIFLSAFLKLFLSLSSEARKSRLPLSNSDEKLGLTTVPSSGFLFQDVFRRDSLASHQPAILLVQAQVSFPLVNDSLETEQPS